jgi:hypothetical protein
MPHQPHRDQQCHQRIADRYHRLRNDQRKVCRLAALVECRKLSDDRPGKRSDGSRSRNQCKLGEKLEKLPRTGRQHADHDIHAYLTAFPGNRAASREHAADHQEEHDLLGPRYRHAEEITSYDVGEIDRDAAEQANTRNCAGNCQQPTYACDENLDHRRTCRAALTRVSDYWLGACRVRFAASVTIS